MPTDLVSMLIDLLREPGMHADTSRRAHERREDETRALQERMRKSPFYGVDPKDRSPVSLGRGRVEGHAHEIEGRAWRLVVALPAPHPGFIVSPRGGRRGLPTVVTADVAFDRRFVVLGEPGQLAFVRRDVRSLWVHAKCDWLYAAGTMTATVHNFVSRHHILTLLAHGLVMAEALLEAQVDTPRALLETVRDPAWKVAAAALDALLLHPGSYELAEAYRRLAESQEPERARLRAHAFRVAEDWPRLRDEALGPHRAARSDAFEALVNLGPRELAQEAASSVLGSRTGLDDARAYWVMQASKDRHARLFAATTAAQRERFLVHFIDIDDSVLEGVATELLMSSGTAVALGELASRGSQAPRSAALALRMRARLSAATLALVEESSSGGLSIADDES